MQNGITTKVDLFDSCSGCKACSLWKNDDPDWKIHRLHVTLTRGNAVFKTDVCTAPYDKPPSKRTVSSHFAFLANLPGDMDDLRSDEGLVLPSLARGAVTQRAALAKFFTPAELAQLRDGVQVVALDSAE
jgi:hypothetical protein